MDKKTEQLFTKALAATKSGRQRTKYTIHAHFVRRDGSKDAFWSRTGLTKAQAERLAKEQRAEGGIARIVPDDAFGYTPKFQPALVAFLDTLKWKHVPLSAPWLGPRIPGPSIPGAYGRVALGRDRAKKVLELAGLPPRLPRPGYVMTIVERHGNQPGLELENKSGRFTLIREG